MDILLAARFLLNSSESRHSQEPAIDADMMHTNAAKAGEPLPDSRDNAEIQELMDLLSTEDLHNFSLLGIQQLQSSSNPAMRQTAKLLTQEHMTIFEVEQLIRGRS